MLLSLQVFLGTSLHNQEFSSAWQEMDYYSAGLHKSIQSKFSQVIIVLSCILKINFFRFHTPLNATLTTGGASAVLAFLLDIETLADMVSIGTLLAFTIVCSAVLTIRYSSPKRPYQSAAMTTAFIILISIAAFVAVFQLHWIIITIAGSLALIPAVLLFFQETENVPETFATPLVPLVPLLGITFNVFMMANLGYATWIRLVVWLVIGVLFYFIYGIRKSKQT